MNGMKTTKQKLIPAVVPWSVSTSDPCMEVGMDSDGRPEWVSFVAYFKLADRGKSDEVCPSRINKAPGPFKISSGGAVAPYNLVRIRFHDGQALRRRAAFSDHEVIREDAFDWSAVAGALRPGEDALANINRTNEFWIISGMSPDPSFYEVRDSEWLEELNLSLGRAHHYIIVGQDDYIEVAAGSWDCEYGQAV